MTPSPGLYDGASTLLTRLIAMLRDERNPGAGRAVAHEGTLNVGTTE
jgi:hypothetical protein